MWPKIKKILVIGLELGFLFSKTCILKFQGVNLPKNHRYIFKSFLMSYFITKETKLKQNNKCYINSSKDNLQAAF